MGYFIKNKESFMFKSPEELLKELTLDQKLAQLNAHGWPADFEDGKKFNKEYAKENFPNGIFGLMVPVDLTPAEIGEWAREMLEFFKEVTPVPPVLMCESLHGILGKETTVFPQSIAMGASFDTELMERVGRAIGKEAKALGIRMSLAPDLDLGREPRWGRIEETYGEDSYLVGSMGEAYVKGLLGEDKKYAATLKHFAAHGSPKSGVNIASVTVTEQELRDKYLPPFKRALEAGAMCVMPAYSALNGEPCHSSSHLMNHILREELGFEGVVISDFGALEMLTYFQCVAEDERDAAMLAVSCGIDVEAPSPWAYGKNLQKMIEEGKISIEEVDKLVLRVLKLKEKLGLFQMEAPDIEEIERVVNCQEHKALAREAAEKSIVLLKNEGALPLKRGSKIAVVGSNAFSVQLGDYTLPRPGAKTPVEAITECAQKFGATVKSAKGCEVYGTDKSGFEEALEIAKEADTIVCVIGGKSMKGYGVGWGSYEEAILTCGEGCDMHDLTPGGVQLDLVREMIKTGRDVVVIMIDGRPETLFDVAENCGALVAAWYPGEEGSQALASLLFGEKEFSAKLPVTFPKHTGQLPLCYDNPFADYGFYHTPGTIEKPGRDYVFCDTKPAFPFGYGIGYSQIVYHSATAEMVDGELLVTVEIENKGTAPKDEPILVYIRDEIASFPQPVKKLASVKKATLPPQKTEKITLQIPQDSLMFTGSDLEKHQEPGWFTITAGNISTRIYIPNEKCF